MLSLFLTLYKSFFKKIKNISKKIIFIIISVYLQYLIKFPLYIYIIFFEKFDYFFYLTIINTMRVYYLIIYKILFLQQTNNNTKQIKLFNKAFYKNKLIYIVYENDEHTIFPFIFNIIQKKNVLLFLKKLPSTIFFNSEQNHSYYYQSMYDYKNFIETMHIKSEIICVYHKEIYQQLYLEKKIVDNIDTFVITIINDNKESIYYNFEQINV